MVPTTLQNATEKDIDLVLELIRALADFEHLGHEVTATRERLRDALFGPRPAAEVVHLGELEGRPGAHCYRVRWYDPAHVAGRRHRFVLTANGARPELAGDPFD